MHTIQARPTLCQTPTINSVAMIIFMMCKLYRRPNLKDKPATPLDLFLDHCHISAEVSNTEPPPRQSEEDDYFSSLPTQ